MKKGIRWYSPLYLAPSVQKLERTIRYEMKYRRVPLGYYFITLPECESDMFDIWSSEQLKMPWMRNRQIDIIGAAGSLGEAKTLAGTIICEMYKATGGFDVRSYLGYE